MSFWSYLEQGDWVKLWSVLAADPTPDATAIRAMLLARWWDSPLDAKEEAARAVAIMRTPLALSAEAYVALLQGDGQSVPRLLNALQQTPAGPHKPWLNQWLMIEHAGRSKEFEQQLFMIKKVLKNPPSSSLNWLYLACLASVDRDSEKNYQLVKLIRNNVSSSSLYKLLLLELEDDSEKMKLAIERLQENYQSDYWVQLHYAYYLIKLGEAWPALKQFDQLAKNGSLDGGGLIRWLTLAISHPAGLEALEARLKHAEYLAPRSIRFRGAIASYLLIYAWMNNRPDVAHAVYSQTSEYKDASLSKNEEPNRSFYNYILKLFIFRQGNVLEGNPDTDIMYTLGESHSLSPHDDTIIFPENIVKGKSCFVMGVKMFHLGSPQKNIYKECIIAHIKKVPLDKRIMFTIGDIDCRGNEGIWLQSKKTSRNVIDIAHETVRNYVNFLKEMLDDKDRTLITVQGVPAPTSNNILETLSEKEEEGLFVKMIEEVNLVLKQEVLNQGWSFLDVYAATVSGSGRAHDEWHLDGYHLKPSFYRTAHRWLVQPDRAAS